MRTQISAFVITTVLVGSVHAQPAGVKKGGLTRAEVEAILKEAALPDRHEKMLRQYLEHLPKSASKDRIEDLRRVLKQLGTRRSPMKYGLPSVDPSDARLYNRLKVRLETPGENMIVDFGLPQNTGQVLGEIYPGTPVADAGFKANDILIELNGQPVPGDVKTFAKGLNAIAKDVPVRAIVLRKGEMVTIERIVFADSPLAP